MIYQLAESSHLYTIMNLILNYSTIIQNPIILYFKVETIPVELDRFLRALKLTLSFQKLIVHSSYTRVNLKKTPRSN